MWRTLGILLAMSLAAVCLTLEPGCSRFQYEEKLLEKVIRSEIRMESFEELLKKTAGSVEENMQTIKGFKNTVQELQKEIASLKSANNQRSDIYTRWGRRTCPGAKEPVYEGFASGGHYTHAGGSGNYICLPQDPIFDGNGRTASDDRKFYGAEYETGSATFQQSLNNKDVPCVVCRVVGRHVLMIPARNA